MEKEEPIQRYVTPGIEGKKGGIHLRFGVDFVRELMNDWGAWNRPMWVIQKGDVCPFHGYAHVQVFPPDKKPMTCLEAYLMKEKERF